jgi:hypothetical protein
MGGPGSGRWRDSKKRDIVDCSLTQSMTSLSKLGLDPSCESSGSITLESPGSGAAKVSLEYRLDTSLGKPLLSLCYSVGENSEIAWIGLQKTRPHCEGFGRGSRAHLLLKRERSAGVELGIFTYRLGRRNSAAVSARV